MSEIKTTLRQANISRQREWDKDSKISIEYRGNELAGEVGEACNIIKKIARERMGIVGSRATVDQLAEELADVVICADLIAMGEGIDLLGHAVPAKFNATSEKVGMKTRLLADPQDRIAALEAENEMLRCALERLLRTAEEELHDADHALGVYEARAALEVKPKASDQILSLLDDREEAYVKQGLREEDLP